MRTVRVTGFATPDRVLLARRALGRVFGDTTITDVTLVVGPAPYIEVTLDLPRDDDENTDALVRSTVVEAVAKASPPAASAELLEFRDDTDARLAALTDEVAGLGEQIAALTVLCNDRLPPHPTGR